MSDRFFRRGTTKAYWVPTIATKDAPTAAEVAAGTRLAGIANIEGFVYENSPIQTPDLDNEFTTSIEGEDTAADSVLTFYEKKTTNPLRATLAKGTSGYIVIFFAGLAGNTPAAGDDCEVWPVTSTGPRRAYSMGNEAAQWSAKFAVNDVPEVDASVAA